MPKHESFINPYRFVDKEILKDQIDIEELGKVPKHEKFEGISGVIHAELINLTPLYIGGRRNPRDPDDSEKSFIHNPEDNLPLIPGSSLKGCISTIYEILAGKQACRCIFGEIGNTNRKGHVFFSDAFMLTYITINGLEKVFTMMRSPNENYEVFYHKEKNKSKKIKLYHHQPRKKTPKGLSNNRKKGKPELFPIPSLCSFKFTVNFENLNPLQLSVFLRSIFLQEGLCHKIGGGKPLGAGSINIRPLSIEVYEDKKEYYAGVNNIQKFRSHQECISKIDKLQSVEIQGDLQKMLFWSPKDQGFYKYPTGQNWFRENRNPLKTVDEIYPDITKDLIEISKKDIDKKWKEAEEQKKEFEKQKREERKIQKKKKKKEKEKRKKEEEFNKLSPQEQLLALWKDPHSKK